MSVKVTDKDIVLLGHGSYQGGAVNFKLPERIDLYILQPLGYSLTTDVANALINQKLIDELKLHHVENGHEIPLAPSVIDTPTVVFHGGSLAPDLILYNLGDLSEWGKKTIGDKKNVVTVKEQTALSQLIATDDKINLALRSLPENERLKLYWSACANQVDGYYASLT